MSQAHGGTGRRADGVVERFVPVNGKPCRVWEKGEGRPLCYLAGIGGLPNWTPFLDRLAAGRRVIAPSLPGLPGSEGHDQLDSHLDWLMASRDLLEAAGLRGGDLIGSSMAGALAADVAALWPEMVRKLVLVAPFGLFDEADPIADIWAQKPGATAGLVCADPENFKRAQVQPVGMDPADWVIVQVRVNEALARIFWPVGDTRLARRLGHIRRPVLLLWGDRDKVVPRSYARRFAEGIAGPSRTVVIADAGHLAELDQPEAVAAAILEFAA